MTGPRRPITSARVAALALASLLGANLARPATAGPKALTGHLAAPCRGSF